MAPMTIKTTKKSYTVSLSFIKGVISILLWYYAQNFFQYFRNHHSYKRVNQECKGDFIFNVFALTEGTLFIVPLLHLEFLQYRVDQVESNIFLERERKSTSCWWWIIHTLNTRHTSRQERRNFIIPGSTWSVHLVNFKVLFRLWIILLWNKEKGSMKEKYIH